MTNKEKICALKKVQAHRKEISNLLVQIIQDTYDYHCQSLLDFSIGDDSIYVYYEYNCRGEYGHDEVFIPIEWLDEGFDYKAAYKEKLRQAELARIREEKKEKKRLERLRKARAKLEKERDYEKYLALKKKYEGGTK